MSAPSRASRGGSSQRGNSRSPLIKGGRGSRGSDSTHGARVKGSEAARGRNDSKNAKAEGLLQGLRTGRGARGGTKIFCAHQHRLLGRMSSWRILATAREYIATSLADHDAHVGRGPSSRAQMNENPKRSTAHGLQPISRSSSPRFGQSNTARELVESMQEKYNTVSGLAQHAH